MRLGLAGVVPWASQASVYSQPYEALEVAGEEGAEGFLLVSQAARYSQPFEVLEVVGTGEFEEPEGALNPFLASQAARYPGPCEACQA